MHTAEPCPGALDPSAVLSQKKSEEPGPKAPVVKATRAQVSPETPSLGRGRGGAPGGPMGSAEEQGPGPAVLSARGRG